MAEIVNLIAGFCVVLAVLIAILSTSLKNAIGELPLFLIEAALLVIIIGLAVYGQNISRS
ncbi:MAG: hypothetical protein ACXACX_20455 [Candidatus Hodarchaeales archaeon]|jgi:hypothetical protein